VQIETGAAKGPPDGVHGGDNLALVIGRQTRKQFRQPAYGLDPVADLRIAARLLRYLWQSGLIYFPITLD